MGASVDVNASAEFEARLQELLAENQALREREHRLRTALEACLAGVWVWDPGANAADCDGRAAEMLGLDQRPSSHSVEALLSRLHPDDRAAVKECLTSESLCDEPLRVVARVQAKEGSFRWVRIAAKAISGPSRLPVRVVASIIDAHEAIVAEQAASALSNKQERQIRERTKELQNSREELEEMCYAVSHDLRAPLRSINGFSKAIETEYGDMMDATALDYLRRIQRATVNLADLLDGLLSMVRVSQVDVVAEDVDVTQLAHAVITELEDAHAGRRVRAQVQDGMRAQGDPRLLRLLILNLLSNAWKFTRGREDAAVEISCDEEGVFSVRDNGVGFDMRYSDKLYKPFSKVHAPGEFPGSGIGLAVAHRIVRRHGGALWAESRIGEGATFYFSVAAGSAGSRAALATATPASPADTANSTRA